MRRLWPRSLLGGNLLLLTSLIVAGQLCAIAIFLFFIQGPRVDNVATMEASQIALLDRVLSTLPAAARRQQIAALHGVPDAALAVPPTAPSSLDSYWLRRFFTTLLIHLPSDIAVRWDGRGNAKQLWVRLSTPLGAPPGHDWIALDRKSVV